MRAGKRLVKVKERLAARDREQARPRVIIWLPRKNGDTTPPGVVSQRGNVLTALYDPRYPDPPLPAGW